MNTFLNAPELIHIPWLEPPEFRNYFAENLPNSVFHKFSITVVAEFRNFGFIAEIENGRSA